MPRTVSATIDTAVSKTITEPNYLLELGFSPMLRYAALRTVNWGGYLWSASGLAVQSVDVESANFSLRNHDNALSAIVLGSNLHNISCKIYQHYDSDAELIFSGTLAAAPQIGPRVELSAQYQGHSSKYPSGQIVAPLFNHLMPQGTEIQFGNKTLRFEESR